MSAETNTDKGIIDAANRILIEVMKKPVLKQNLKNILKNIDPDSAPELAKTLLWQEPEFIMMILAALPSIANVVIKLLDQLLVEMVEKFPPDLLNGYFKGVFEDLDQEAVARIQSNFQKFLVVYLTPLFNEKFSPKKDPAKEKMLQEAENG